MTVWRTSKIPAHPGIVRGFRYHQGLLPAEQERHQSVALGLRQKPERRHEPLAAGDLLCDRILGEAVRHPRQGGKGLVGASFPVHPVTACAIDPEKPAAARSAFRIQFHHLKNPRHLVAVDVQDAGRRIEAGSTPLTASVEARKYHGTLRTWRHKLSVRSNRSKALQHERVGLGRDVGDVVLVESLPGKVALRQGTAVRPSRDPVRIHSRSL